jgi:hypothetical protein
MLLSDTRDLRVIILQESPHAQSRSLVSDRSQGPKAVRDDKILRVQKILRIQPFSDDQRNSFCPKYLRILAGKI